MRHAVLGGVLLGGLLVANPAARPAGAAADHQPVTSTGPVTPARPDQGSRLRGVVVDEGGVPLEGVMVRVAPVGPSAGRVPEIAILTDARGRFEWPPLSDGRYAVTIAPEGYIPEGEEVSLPAAASTQLAFRLRRHAGR